MGHINSGDIFFLRSMLQKTSLFMGIDHANRLEISVNDGSPDKLHTALFQVSRHCIRKRGMRQSFFIHNLVPGPMPDIVGKALIFLPDLAEYSGIGDSGTYL